MSKQINIKSKGKVIAVLADLKFRVELDLNGHKCICHPSGKMKTNNIKILEGDVVDIEFSPYDFNKGRIVYRYK